MADFDANIVSAHQVVDWEDAGNGVLPSRLNAKAGLPHRYVKIDMGSIVTVKANVGGVVGPADASLGGRLFINWFAECPFDSPPVVGSPAGYSSVVTFIPQYVGAYLFGFYRPQGGGVFIHFSVEMPT